VRIRPRQLISLDGSQFLEASPNFVIINGQRLPDFHGVPSFLFAPMYYADTRLIRPSYWRPRNTELSFDWLLEPVTP
jgi:hypothetical protein